MAITDRQMDELMKEFEKTQMNKAWVHREDYDRALMRSMQDELEHYWEFQTWLRFTHPEVIDEFKAIQDIKERANDIK